jgi:holliday junction DNA helicase RuvB
MFSPMANIIRQRSGLTDTHQSEFDLREEQTIRPKHLAEYIGQSQLKETLGISMDAAKQRSEPLDHILLYGPPGLGKTTMAMVLAEEMNAEIHITSAPALERPRDVVGLLMALKPGSVLFIDEIHRLNKVAEEILYPALEDFTLDRTLGKGHMTKILRVPLPRFTLIGATTKAGSISSPLRDRFGMVYRLNFYNDQELVQIIQRTASILSIQVSQEGAQAIARRSRGTPRIANRLLRRVRDYVQVRKAGQDTIDPISAEEAMDLFEIDKLGLDPTDRLLLTKIIEDFSGGPVGIETLAASIGEDIRTIEDVYEPFLLQAGMLQRTPRGRVISPKAFQHLYPGRSIPQGLVQQQLLFDPSLAPLSE